MNTVFFAVAWFVRIGEWDSPGVGLILLDLAMFPFLGARSESIFIFVGCALLSSASRGALAVWIMWMKAKHNAESWK